MNPIDPLSAYKHDPSNGPVNAGEALWWWSKSEEFTFDWNPPATHIYENNCNFCKMCSFSLRGHSMTSILKRTCTSVLNPDAHALTIAIFCTECDFVVVDVCSIGWQHILQVGSPRSHRVANAMTCQFLAASPAADFSNSLWEDRRRVSVPIHQLLFCRSNCYWFIWEKFCGVEAIKIPPKEILCANLCLWRQSASDSALNLECVLDMQFRPTLSIFAISQIPDLEASVCGDWCFGFTL